MQQAIVSPTPASAPLSQILIVDDHPIITDALATALLSLHIVDSLAKEPSVAAAIERLDAGESYNLVVLDLHLRDCDGVEAIRTLRERFPELPVVIFSGDESGETVTAAFEHGVQGYIPKSSPMPVVINALRIVLSGGNYIPPQAARMLGFDTRAAPALRSASEPRALPSLSPRQRQVLHYLLQGLPNKVIGTRLDMADGTVKSHLNTIYRMFSVNSRAQLILKARDLGLL
jgi:DNA-binding NarL/FixJ family response regulator